MQYPRAPGLLHVQFYINKCAHSVYHDFFFLSSPPKDVSLCQQSENTTCLSVQIACDFHL